MFHGTPQFNSLVMLINSQLVCWSAPCQLRFLSLPCLFGIFVSFQLKSHAWKLGSWSYNLGQNKWNIWTTPPPILMMAKYCVFAPLLLHHCFGGKGVNCSFLFCPRLKVHQLHIDFQLQKCIPANSHALGVSLTPAGWKLRSHAYSRLQADFSRLIEKCQLLPSCLTQFPKTCQLRPM